MVKNTNNFNRCISALNQSFCDKRIQQPLFPKGNLCG